jgi:ABC-type bacteriocin/lantibiotic exporter with double-glycine peptidase domain
VFILIVLLMIGPVAGCAERSFADLRSGLETRGDYIEGVLFYRQEENSCGPASLANVASFWGQQVSLEQIVARVYLLELKGTLPMDMEKYLRDGGFETVSFSGTPAGLRDRIRGNVPVICLLDLGFGLYVTVIGFDDVGNVFVVHDGLTANRVIGYDTFIREWGRAGNWMLVALPGTARAGDKQ